MKGIGRRRSVQTTFCAADTLPSRGRHRAVHESSGREVPVCRGADRNPRRVDRSREKSVRQMLLPASAALAATAEADANSAMERGRIERQGDQVNEWRSSARLPGYYVENCRQSLRNTSQDPLIPARTAIKPISNPSAVFEPFRYICSEAFPILPQSVCSCQEAAAYIQRPIKLSNLPSKALSAEW